eukprot:CAMPEP_0181483690 /NCGR_PEP_ID=MMETSP1110-20121109/45565_1 /TAXON_ID=174948 /ORGANISM="Symbiodinium sp., Strain CCMP421" /LENGTH=31 /DNA_ID= /DNA_START= /DNA_END= /DNA_ORIENTATION=
MSSSPGTSRDSGPESEAQTWIRAIVPLGQIG